MTPPLGTHGRRRRRRGKNRRWDGRRGGGGYGRGGHYDPGAASVERSEEAKEIEARFDRLTAAPPDERFFFETSPNELTTRVVDLLAPIGKGQRVLIPAPPKTGKTLLLQKTALGLRKNHPDVDVMVLLVDERPEEVTDFKRSVDAEIFASCSDEPLENHIRTSEEVFLEAKRRVLTGKDVVVFLDSLTRLARAFNTWAGNSGKTLSGGLDSTAMARPRRFFGGARKVEEGGSLTLIATALIETGSRMDDVIFQEFKGTGNCEIVLSRKLAENRVFPAIDIGATSTRREELLYHPDEIPRIQAVRRALSVIPDPLEAMKLLLERLRGTKSNMEFLLQIGEIPLGR